MPMARTLNIDDKSVELAIPLDIIGPSVIDISKLYGQPRVSTYDPGFTSPAACESKITYIDAGIRIRPRLYSHRTGVPRYPEASKWRRNAIQGKACSPGESTRIARTGQNMTIVTELDAAAPACTSILHLESRSITWSLISRSRSTRPLSGAWRRSLPRTPSKTEHAVEDRFRPG